MAENLPARRTTADVAVRPANLPAVPAPPPAELPEPHGTRIDLFTVVVAVAITIPAAGSIAGSVL